jgi:hypothetical protein
VCLRFLSIFVVTSLLAPLTWAAELLPELPAVELAPVKQFVQARAADARDLTLGPPAPQPVMPTDLDCTTLYNRRVALMRGQVDHQATDYFSDPRIGASTVLGAVWTPAFYYLPFRTLQRFQAEQRRPQQQTAIDELRAASAAQRCFEH